MNQEDQSTTPKRKYPLLPQDAREMEKVSNYTDKKIAEVDELSAKFTNMGYLKLLWDSKVPDKDRTFYYRFSITASNREDILKEIAKYHEFYKEMSDAVLKVSHPEKKTDSEHLEPYELILDLNEKLSKLAEAAKLGKSTTASSAVCNLHKSFIEKHQKLENMIKRVECVALKEGLKKATDDLQESVQSFNKLQSDMRSTQEKCDFMCDRLDRLMLQTEMICDQKRDLQESNQKLEQQNEILLQDNSICTARLKIMKCENLDEK